MSITTYAVTGARVVRTAALIVAIALLVSVVALQAFAAHYGQLASQDLPSGAGSGDTPSVFGTATP